MVKLKPLVTILLQKGFQMKNLLLIAAFALLVACSTPQTVENKTSTQIFMQ